MKYTFKLLSSIKYIILSGIVAFSNIYALPSPKEIIQIQENFKKVPDFKKNIYFKDLFELSENLKRLGREEEYESVIISLSTHRYYRAITPAIKIHIKYKNLKEAELLYSLQINPENAFLLGEFHLKGLHLEAEKEKAYEYFVYAASKKHIKSIQVLKENIKNGKLSRNTKVKKKKKKTKKQRILELKSYNKLCNTYLDIPFILEILNSIPHSKNNKIINKDAIINDLTQLVHLHNSNNLKKNKNIELIHKFLNQKIKK